ncbi:MAG: CheR family methyltransferase [Desulfurivibrionaceae bacterium]
MKDNDCIDFLQWALPRLGMRWPGFRKVRGQVCKRLDRRLRILKLADLQEYRNLLDDNPEEWQILDSLCRITISRFYRDKKVFTVLAKKVLPELAEQVRAGQEKCLHLWSVGCASGEEPYTLALIWFFSLGEQFPEISLQILGTDVDPFLLERAGKGCYPGSSVKDLPEQWRKEAFLKVDRSYCLEERFRKPVKFRQQDVRHTLPDGPFHLVLCRNLVFTYFDLPLQHDFLARISRSMSTNGILVIGSQEHLPEGQTFFEDLMGGHGIYRKL